MCIFYAAGVCRGSCALTHTFGCIVHIPEGIKSVRSIKRGFLGPKQWDGQQEIPSFFSALLKPEVLNPLTLGYQSDHLLLTDAQNSVDMNE